MALIFLHKQRCLRAPNPRSVTVFLFSFKIWKMDYNDTNTGPISRLHTLPVYSNSHILTACWWHVCTPNWNCLLLMSLQFIRHYYSLGNVQYVGGQLGRLGLGAVHPGSAAKGPEGFLQGGLVCLRQVIKMEVCLNKDTLGSFFSHRARQSPAVHRYVKKTWHPSKN